MVDKNPGKNPPAKEDEVSKPTGQLFDGIVNKWGFDPSKAPEVLAGENH
jgi:hypothetical protein